MPNPYLPMNHQNIDDIPLEDEPVEEDGELLYPDSQGNYTIRD